MGWRWVIAIGLPALVLLFIIPITKKLKKIINKALKKNNSLFATAITLIILFSVLLVALVFSAYQLCDLMKADDFLKDLIRSLLPVFCTFVSTVAIFASESDRADSYNNRSVKPYLSIGSFSSNSHQCESIVLTNIGLKSACYVKVIARENLDMVARHRRNQKKYLSKKPIECSKSENIPTKDSKAFNILTLNYEIYDYYIIYKDIYDNAYKQEIKFNVKNNVVTPTLSSPKYVTEKELVEMEKE